MAAFHGYQVILVLETEESICFLVFTVDRMVRTAMHLVISSRWISRKTRRVMPILISKKKRTRPCHRWCAAPAAWNTNASKAPGDAATGGLVRICCLRMSQRGSHWCWSCWRDLTDADLGDDTESANDEKPGRAGPLHHRALA